MTILWPNIPYIVYLRISLYIVFQDPHAEEFEDKEWTFVIENVSTIFFL